VSNFDELLKLIQDKKEIEEALKSGPIPVPTAGETHFTGPKVFALLVNPIYAGLAEYPAIINDDDWIRTVSKMIEGYGPELVLRVMLDSLRQSIGQV
jgi:hypothetical protein